MSKGSRIFGGNRSTSSIYSPAIMKTTVDGWEVLHAIVQCGGFSAAAERLNRSQSTLSYAVTRLQDRLGITLLELKGRKAHLTEAGRVLLADAEPHLAGFHQLEERARSLASGGASDIRLSVDSIYPNDRLFAALRELTRRFPHVHPQLRQATFMSAETEFSSHGANLCVSALMSREYYATPVLEVRLLAVAHRDHPMHAVRRPLSRVDLIRHTIVTIEGMAGSVPKRQPRSPAQRFLAVTSIEAAIEAVRSGLCFGWLPGYRLEPYIKTREIRPLRFPVGSTREVRLHIVCKDVHTDSRELTALAELLGLGRRMEVI
jgi:DNA-binding transcriptional LysR family regulator